MKKLNMFVGATTFGSGLVATFDLGADKITDYSTIRHVASKLGFIDGIYEKTPDIGKISAWSVSGATNSIQGHIKAIGTENKRVGALNALVKELESLRACGETGIITCNVPDCLYGEIVSGRVKYVLAGETESTYYSNIELELWKSFLPIHQEMYMQLVFNPLEKVALARKGENMAEATPIRARRILLYSQMRQELNVRFMDEKEARKNMPNQSAPATNAFSA